MFVKEEEIDAVMDSIKTLKYRLDIRQLRSVSKELYCLYYQFMIAAEDLEDDYDLKRNKCE